MLLILRRRAITICCKYIIKHIISIEIPRTHTPQILMVALMILTVAMARMILTVALMIPMEAMAPTILTVALMTLTVAMAHTIPMVAMAPMIPMEAIHMEVATIHTVAITHNQTSWNKS